MTRWFEDEKILPFIEGDVGTYWSTAVMAYQALNNQYMRVHEYEHYGPIKITEAELLEKVRELGGRLYLTKPEHKFSKNKSEHSFVWDEGNMTVTKNDDDYSFSVVVTSEVLVTSIRELIESIATHKVTKDKIYVLHSTNDGVKPTTLGKAGVKFEVDNYRPEVVEAFEHVIEDLDKADPCGRLVVFDGPPGTGKTFMIRSLLSRAKNSLFIMVPAIMVHELATPALMNTLLDLRKEAKKESAATVFVIEDADSCLVPRKGDNIDSISSLLNVSDGILGAMIDLRIICTTNATVGEMDEAMMRPGRLCRRIEVGMLDADQAQKVYARINEGLDGGFPKTKFFTLAEVYRAKKEGGWHEGLAHGQGRSKSRKAGFSAS